MITGYVLSVTRVDLVIACETAIWQAMLNGVSVNGAPAPRAETRRLLHQLLEQDDLRRHQIKDDLMQKIAPHMIRRRKK